MKHTERVYHEGIVKNISADKIEVLINSLSACAGCHARGACGMSDMKQKIVEVPNNGEQLQVGDKVRVYACLEQAFYSVFLSYIMPSVLIIATIFFLQENGSSELTAAISSLVLLVGYFFIVYLFRNRISRKVRFTIEKIGNY